MKTLVVCGSTFSGKSTLANRLCNQDGAMFQEVVSTTTRAPREGEIDGKSYHFISHQEFQRDLHAGHFVDSSVINGNGYGSRLDDYHQIMLNDKHPILVCDPMGAINLRQYQRQNPKFEFVSVYLGCPVELQAGRALTSLIVDETEILQAINNGEKHPTISRLSRITGSSDNAVEYFMDRVTTGRASVSDLSALLRAHAETNPEKNWSSMTNYDLMIDEFNKENGEACIDQVSRLVGIPLQPAPIATNNHQIHAQDYSC